MTTGTTTTKVRLVQCPKCRHVLQEMPNVPVYQCGGCFTFLQAKSQRQTVSSLPETRAEETCNSDHVSEENAPSSLSHNTTLQCAEECHSEHNNGMCQTESGDVNHIDNLRGKNTASEDESNMGDRNCSTIGGENIEYNLPNNVQKSGSTDSRHQHDSSTSSEDCSSKEPAKGELLRPTSVRTRFRVKDNGESSLNAVNTEAETTSPNREIGSVYQSQGFCSIIATGSLRGEKLSSDASVSSPDEPALHGLDRLRSEDTFYVSSNEQMEQPPEISRYRFHHGKATDVFDPTSFVNPRSEVSSVLIDLSKSPMTRSSRAYYDDGVSSYEETDDQLLNRHKHGSNHPHRVANVAAAGTRPPRRDRVPASSNYGSQQPFRNSREILAERTHNPLNHSKLDRDGLLDFAGLGHPGRNWKISERDEHMPRLSFDNKDSLVAANRIPTELYCTSNFTSIDRAAYADQERLELLRMVSELQDQLNKASLNNLTTGQVNWKEIDHQIPMYYDREVEPEESCYNFGDPRYSGRIGDGSNWTQRRKYSQIPHSLCSGPHEQKWSAQLPSRPNLYNSYGSCPSSPQQDVVDPRFHVHSRGAKSDDQMVSDDDGVRKNSREKPQLPKRHLRPLAGGAPFVTCAYCLKELQLPADFLLFKKRCHWLKCGACLQVLKFSLVNSTHLIPYMPVAEVVSRGEFDEPSRHRRNFTSTSHVTDCPSVSCSDKSSSLGNAVDRELSNGLLEHGKERKMCYLNETRSKGKTPMDYESAGPSTSSSNSKNISSEIEELSEEDERGGSSQLHLLMGYSSARHIIYS